jgi:cleavage stimulation factor subunit 3
MAARKLFKRAREDPRSTYHLFIANANLEYFCTKDKAIGFKIFHLGAKKYSHESEFMLAYLKYMSHLNEDNNTRVLFERILSSDEMPTVKSAEIWSEFLRFECAVGDLASIQKVDKKRQKIYEQINPQEASQNTTFIDRYRYLDLLPSSMSELKAMGYKDLPLLTETDLGLNYVDMTNNTNNNNNNNNNNLHPNSPTSLTPLNMTAINSLVNNINLSFTSSAEHHLTAPDISQMLPFKPIRNPVAGLSTLLAGGVFPFPPAVTELVKRLPPPQTFEGPFVKIDEFLSKLLTVNIFEDFTPVYIYPNGEPIKELEHLQSAANTTSAANMQKRPLVFTSMSDDEDSKKTKSMDIYKQRQFQKLKNSRP